MAQIDHMSKLGAEMGETEREEMIAQGRKRQNYARHSVLVVLSHYSKTG
jgi:hypothetical protein